MSLGAQVFLELPTNLWGCEAFQYEQLRSSLAFCLHKRVMNNVLCMGLKHSSSLLVVLRGRAVASDGSLKLTEATWPKKEVDT